MKKDVTKLAEKVVSWIKLYCSRIEIAGSIRRKKTNPGDIDIVLIPKDIAKLEEFLKTKGRRLQGGEHESRWRIEGVNVELYYTTKEEWGATLLAYSSKKGSEIGLRVIAKKEGFKLNSHGLFKGKKRVASRTEKEIYSALGRKWKPAEER